MLKKIVINFLLFSIFSTNLTVQAKNEKALNLGDLIKLTLENNQKIKLEKEKEKLIDAEFYNASVIPNPSFMFEGGYQQMSYKLGFQNNIELGDKRNLRISEVDSKKTLYEGQLELLKQDILYELKKIYYQIYYIQSKIKKYDELIEINNKLLSIAEKKEIAGDIPKLDVIQVKLLLLNLKNEKEKNQEELELYLINLENISGNKIDIQNIIIKAPEKIDTCLNKTNQSKTQMIESLTKKAIVNRYETKDFSNKKINFELQRKLAIANALPNLNVYYGLDVFKDNTMKTGLFTNVGMEIPVFDFKKGAIKEAEARIEINSAEKTFFEKNLANEITKAYQKYISSMSFKQNYENSILPLTKEMVQKSQLSFSLGKSSIFSALNAQQTLVNQQLNYLQILSDYYNSIIDLEKLTKCI